MEIVPVPVERMRGLASKIEEIVDDIDTVFFLEGSVADEEVALLSRICNRNHITLFVQGMTKTQTQKKTRRNLQH